MKICTKCGAEAFENATICSQCGGNIDNSPQKPTVQKQPQNFQQMMNVNQPRKFCSSCGAEIFNNSVICTSCGCLVGNIQPQRKATNAQYTQNGEKLVSIFNFINGIFALLSMFFVFASLVWAYIDIDIYDSYKYGYSVYGYFYPDYGFGLFGMITSIVTFTLGITTLIISIVKRQKTDCIFSSIRKVTFSVLMMLLSIMVI